MINYLSILARFALLLLLLPPLNVMGQERGVTLGIGMSTFTGSETGEQYNSIPSMSLGAYLTYPVSNNTSVKFAFSIMNKGALISSVGELYLHNILIYTGAPIHVTAYLFDLGPLAVDVELGLMPSMLIFGINDVGVMENIHEWDVGLLAGISINHSSARMCLQIDQGLRKLLPRETAENRNRTYSVTMALPLAWRE